LPIHIKALPGDVATRVLVTGDPGRSTVMARELLEDYRLINDNRGLLAYTGFFNGVEVTIATHGIGGPSALIVFEELASLGARYIVRLGTAGSLSKSINIGDVVVASAASCMHGGCGLGQYYGGVTPPAAPDPALVNTLYMSVSKRLATHMGPVFSSDSFYAEDEVLANRLSRLGFIAIEMEVAPLYALSWLRGFRAAALLVISNSLVDEREREHRDLSNVVLEAGRAGLEALTSI